MHIGAMPAAFAGTGAGVFDIVGLRLGMTPQEARSALLANDPFRGPGMEAGGRLRFNAGPGLGVERNFEL